MTWYLILELTLAIPMQSEYACMEAMKFYKSECFVQCINTRTGVVRPAKKDGKK